MRWHSSNSNIVATLVSIRYRHSHVLHSLCVWSWQSALIHIWDLGRMGSSPRRHRWIAWLSRCCPAVLLKMSRPSCDYSVTMLIMMRYSKPHALRNLFVWKPALGIICGSCHHLCTVLLCLSFLEQIFLETVFKHLVYQWI